MPPESCILRKDVVVCMVPQKGRVHCLHAKSLGYIKGKDAFASVREEWCEYLCFRIPVVCCLLIGRAITDTQCWGKGRRFLPHDGYALPRA